MDGADSNKRTRQGLECYSKGGSQPGENNVINILPNCAIEEYNQRIFKVDGVLTDEGEDEESASSSESELLLASSGGRAAETERRLCRFDAMLRENFERKRKFA